MFLTIVSKTMESPAMMMKEVKLAEGSKKTKSTKTHKSGMEVAECKAACYYAPVKGDCGGEELLLQVILLHASRNVHSLDILEG